MTSGFSPRLIWLSPFLRFWITYYVGIPDMIVYGSLKNVPIPTLSKTQTPRCHSSIAGKFPSKKWRFWLGKSSNQTEDLIHSQVKNRIRRVHKCSMYPKKPSSKKNRHIMGLSWFVSKCGKRDPNFRWLTNYIPLNIPWYNFRGQFSRQYSLVFDPWLAPKHGWLHLSYPPTYA